jgi:hypothetical protein
VRNGKREELPLPQQHKSANLKPKKRRVPSSDGQTGKPRDFLTIPLKVGFPFGKLESAGSWIGCPRNDQNFVSVQTETNRNSICFGCFSVCFAKPKKNFFGLFRFVSVFRTGIETTETNRTFRNKPKQTEKIPKNALFKTLT